MVVPPLGLPDVVPGRARYAHKRGSPRRVAGPAVTRLPPQPSELIDRSKTFTFTFDGRAVTAFEGDTLGSALYAAGRRTFSRSFKYHRRRGLMCCTGSCPNCLVT